MKILSHCSSQLVLQLLLTRFVLELQILLQVSSGQNEATWRRLVATVGARGAAVRPARCPARLVEALTWWSARPRMVSPRTFFWVSLPVLVETDDLLLPSAARCAGLHNG